MATNVSSISKALANAAGSIHIPKPADVPESNKNTVHGAAFAAKGHSASALPTPPNSISPHLSAHSLAARVHRDVVESPPSQVDSDVELGDAIDSAKNSSGPAHGTVENGHGTITPSLIARDYLPGVILGKGQVPVKDVINHLCKHLPGFADIPPAKARRIVGAALEGHVGGPDGNVEFEKTGWGRWNARIRSQPLRTINEHYAATTGGFSSPAVKIPGAPSASVRKPRRTSAGSWAADSSMSSPDDQMDHTEPEVFHQDVDAMSVDGDGDQGMRYAPSHKQHAATATYSDTDEEDWASMGPSSFWGSSVNSRGGIHKHMKLHRGGRTRSPMPGGFARSLPAGYPSAPHQQPRPPLNLDFTGIDANTQEREAIEALIRMGSM
ncbi:MAG: hypothetical protein Q9162_003490 [Coniocarpon cinnabarinum]